MIGPKDKPSDFGYYGLVYLATNKINGKVYVGITRKYLNRRISEHLAKLKSKKLYAFHRALIKYGIDSFTFEVIDECLTKDSLREKEIYYIALYQAFSREKGYNLTTGGEGGFQMSQETRDKMSKNKKGKKLTEEHKQNLSKAKKGVKFSEEARKNMSLAHIGYKVKEESKEKISKANKGKIITEEQRAKISKAKKGKKATEEARKNMSLAHIGYHPTEEARNNQSKAQKGREVSEDTRAKISTTLMGHDVPEDVRQKISKTKKGVPLSETARINVAKGHEKSVQQLDFAGNVLAEFPSMKEAASKCNLLRTGISCVCRGKSKSCGGFFWRYKVKEDQPK